MTGLFLTAFEVFRYCRARHPDHGRDGIIRTEEETEACAREMLRIDYDLDLDKTHYAFVRPEYQDGWMIQRRSP